MVMEMNTNRPEEVTEMNTSDRAAQAKELTLRAIEAVANGVKPEDAHALLEQCLADLEG